MLLRRSLESLRLDVIARRRLALPQRNHHLLFQVASHPPPLPSPRPGTVTSTTRLAQDRHGLRAKAPPADARRHRSPRALPPPHLAPAVTPPYRTHGAPARVPHARARHRARCKARAGSVTRCTQSFRCMRWCWPPTAQSSRACRSPPHTPSPSSMPLCIPTASLPIPPAFLSSASSHGRSGEELTHATLLATLSSPPALHALASRLCAAASSNLSVLVGHSGPMKELWQDMVALGVYDSELLDALTWGAEFGGAVSEDDIFLQRSTRA
ncbi:hypothetical protein DFH09DRAFT_1473811 [Mycena vulgaris]|nr:hypothetical protein DFH09DRAFT_1473811 [Mycena vulgaris]